MQTRILMSVSAAFLGGIGLALSFLPQETLGALGVPPVTALVILVQVTGALCLGFAFMNWMARGVLIGGIYSRPLALGNFLHFAVVAATLLKALSALTALDTIVVYALAAAYSVLAAWFGLVLFTSPVAGRSGDGR